MKTLFLILLFSIQGFSSELTEQDKKMDALFEKLELISDKKLDEKTDLETIKSALIALLELEKSDPSRTGVAMLASSYGDHESLYKKAAKQIETPENKKSLKEILGMMKKLSTSGNG
ncbi:MAG: hypothetical protein A2622_02500 [Bdellovibrionales bacterium RIFCSPHIGHO2_01_FULL_40_29]|nr:MAG: hypothetical protein A2622_02500 [Bdellovibrionales bacterium RIFCSPHIGHO2_01_FULL_40_29]OFZ33952.1 MAG: hypothetical protein A3D17_02920 [Bdellovibrionales bacterium RIFCSPHIGHO2_02_FULL_40_15]